MRILVTGARGFIGSAFVRHWVAKHNGDPDYQLIAFMRNTRQFSKTRLDEPSVVQSVNRGSARFVYGDLLGDISGLCENVDVVVNFAAKSFVDHSIRDPLAFIETNVLGTARLLEEARKQNVKKFIQISTDEVYGQILDGKFYEESPCMPRNPYAASKAAAESLVVAYNRTYKMWTAITRTENNYGPFQHPQKAIPTFIRRALNNQKIQIYGDGQHIRQWLFVDDHIEAVNMLAERDDIPGGEIWNIGGGPEIKNVDLAKAILEELAKDKQALEFIDDSKIRPGHDRRYAMDCSKIAEFGWSPSVEFETGLNTTVKWYCNNDTWLRH